MCYTLVVSAVLAFDAVFGAVVVTSITQFAHVFLAFHIGVATDVDAGPLMLLLVLLLPLMLLLLLSQGKNRKMI